METRTGAPDSAAHKVKSDVFERPLIDAVDVATFPGTAFSVAEVLEVLAFTRKTGTIRIWTPEECVRIDVRNGHVVDLESDNAPIGYRLGEILVSQGAITSRELEEYLATSADTGMRIGRGMRSVGLINRKKICVALRHQLIYAMARTLLSEQVTVEFGPRENPFGSVDLYVDLHTALIEATATADAMS